MHVHSPDSKTEHSINSAVKKNWVISHYYWWFVGKFENVLLTDGESAESSGFVSFRAGDLIEACWRISASST